MPLLENLPPQAQLVVGVLLWALGVSFCYKSYLAMIKGKLSYWQGFLPFTIVSPFLLHLPKGKRSLVHETEGLWVHLLMGPAFMIIAILFICAGADIIELPGTSTLNKVLNAGKPGEDLITFTKHDGYRLPVLRKAGPIFASLFKTQRHLGSGEAIVPQNNGSLNDALHQ